MKKLTKEEIRINIYKQDETQKLIEKYEKIFNMYVVDWDW